MQSFLQRLNAALTPIRPDVTMGGIAFGIALAVAAAFLLDDFRRQACPPGTFIYGSTDIGSITVIPWALVGMFACWTALDFASKYASRMSGHTDSPAKADSEWLSRILRRGTVASLLFAVLIAPFGLLTGFCAMDDGISFNAVPWAQSVKYPWQDATAVAVVCYQTIGRGVINHNSFTLTMKDGTEIDLYETPRSFNGGYASLQKAVQNVPLRHDDSQKYATCGSSVLRDLKPFGSDQISPPGE